MGPVEAFTPIGYDEAKAGDGFLIIGIGIVSKLEDRPYSIVPEYPLVNAGEWKVKTKSSQVEFIHKLNDDAYAYEYKKTVELIKGEPEMVLSHSLKNTGKQTIETDVYNHNFFVIDNQTIGKDYVVTFPFDLGSNGGGNLTIGELNKNQIIYNKDLASGENLYFPALQGYSNQSSDYDIRIENRKTGAGVRITSDQPLSKLAFWSAEKTLCPEPFTQIIVKPGKTFKWKIKYQFYEL